MQVECRKCIKQFDPNEDAQWAPPIEKDEHGRFVSVGSIVCPHCGNRTDFHNYKTLTDGQDAPTHGVETSADTEGSG